MDAETCPTRNVKQIADQQRITVGVRRAKTRNLAIDLFYGKSTYDPAEHTICPGFDVSIEAELSRYVHKLHMDINGKDW